jgi:hypothetical protein
MDICFCFVFVFYFFKLTEQEEDKTKHGWQLLLSLTGNFSLAR